MKKIALYPEKVLGPIKPLNGVGGGPLSSNFTFNLVKEFRDAGIPFCRTHDIEYPLGSGEYVDIHCIFPNFDADVNDPRSYNFTFTDAYLQAMLDAGAKPFYRLGTTIEHQPIKRYIFPPKDPIKWGEIASHIISHYNDGWANGFHMEIEYWEIWNEPDLRNRCWTGTDEEFLALYDAASRVIKRDHPQIRLGGCAFCSPYAGLAEKFLAMVAEKGSPCDFFSWHGYCHTPEQAKASSEKADELLKKYHLEHLESIYDEWNYVVAWNDTIQKSIDLHKTVFCGAFVASVLTTLQDTRTDKAMYYDCQMCMPPWNGVFTPNPMHIHGEARTVTCEPPYYALKAWKSLKDAGNQIEADFDGLYGTAATDGNSVVTALIVSYDDSENFAASAPSDEALEFVCPGWKVAEILVTDADHTEESMPPEGFVLKGNSFALVRLIKE